MTLTWMTTNLQDYGLQRERGVYRRLEKRTLFKSSQIMEATMLL